MNNQFEPPCSKDCPDRCPDPNCHMTCDRYLEFRAFLNKKAKDEHSELKEYLEINNRTSVKY